MHSFNSKECGGERQRARNIFVLGILKIQQQKQWNETDVLKCSPRNFSENRETQPTFCSRKKLMRIVNSMMSTSKVTECQRQ